MSVFVDTSALYAVLDRDDQNHRRARHEWERLLDEETDLVVSNYVLAESMALLQRRLGLAALRVLVRDILPVFDLHWISPEEHQGATSAIIVASKRRLSFVDLTSFEAMRTRGLADCFAFDKHFAEQGFHLRPR